MKKQKKISAVMVMLLAMIASAVAVWQSRNAVEGSGVWWLIFAYWVVLTAKNIVDYIGIE